MTKYDPAFKLKLVKQCLAGSSTNGVAVKNGIGHSILQRWVRSYQQHGLPGLARQYSRYDAQFKLSVLQRIEQDGLSDQQAAILFGIRGQNSIGEWKRLYHAGGINALKPHREREPAMPQKPSEKAVQPCPGDDERTRQELLDELGYLRAENAYLKKARCLDPGAECSASQKAHIIQGLRHEHSMQWLLRAAGLAHSTFYYQAKAVARDKHAGLKAHVRRIYEQHKGRYGYRRITAVLRQIGEHANHKTVQRLMQMMGLKSLVRIKKYRSYKGPEGETAPNRLARQFKADLPDQKWVTDVTEFKVNGQKLYLSPVLDLCTREIVAYQTSRRPVFELVSKMLEKALARLGPEQTPLLHSDQGWQYRQVNYRHRLAQKGLQQSMSRKGNCYDNAVMERFFGTLKSEFFYLERFDTVEQLEAGLDEYIHYYNHERISMKLNGLSPVQFRSQIMSL
ncbi:IS3 family transposase [Pseudomonas sp. S2_H01]